MRPWRTLVRTEAPLIREGEVPDVRPLRADARRKRQALLTAAAAAFDRDGIEVTLEEVAREAGVGQATLYRHFPTREALIVGVYLNEFDALCNGIERLLGSLPADEALSTWMEHFVSYVASKRGMSAAIRTIIMNAESDQFQWYKDKLFEAVDRLLGDAESEGLIRSGVTSSDLVMAMGGICLVTDSPELSDQATRLVSLFVDSLRYGSPVYGSLALDTQANDGSGPPQSRRSR
jgi:AcrR family transcriptional regulator